MLIEYMYYDYDYIYIIYHYIICEHITYFWRLVSEDDLNKLIYKKRNQF